MRENEHYTREYVHYTRVNAFQMRTIREKFQ